MSNISIAIGTLISLNDICTFFFSNGTAAHPCAFGIFIACKGILLLLSTRLKWREPGANAPVWCAVSMIIASMNRIILLERKEERAGEKRGKGRGRREEISSTNYTIPIMKKIIVD